MVALWWQRAALESSPGKRALFRLTTAARSCAIEWVRCSRFTTRLLLALAATVSLAQQPPRTAPQVSNSTDPHAAAASTPGTQTPSASSTIPKTGNLPPNLPGALRQQADHRFLAQRGISWESRAKPGTGSMSPAESLRLARAQHQQLLHQAAIRPDTGTTPGTWQSLGPAQVATPAYGAVTGRITSLAADPNSAGNTLYLGATGGGVWKSANAAGPTANVTFTPLTDDLPAFTNTLGSLSIGAITVQPASSNVILAGTGDTNNALDSYYGAGILRSSDAGLTWTLITGSKDAFFNGGRENYTFIGNGFAGFAWSTTNTSLVVAAVAQSVEGILVDAGSMQPNMEVGLYYSTDAGQTWFLGIIEDDSSHIIQSPNVAGLPPGNSVTSAVWNPVRHRFYAAVRFHGYYESTDGITWTRLANQPGPGLTTLSCPTNPGSTGQTTCPIFRGVLAVQPLTGDMFALTTDLNNLDQGLFHDVCSTTGLPVTSCASSTVAFGTQINSGALENGNGDTTIALADYNLTLAAVPSQQDTILFAGTQDIFRCSLANSCAWRNTTNIETCAAAQVAPSQHATESTFGSTGLLYFANDGGLWRSTDTVSQTGSVCASTDASHFQNLNGGLGSLAEITNFSVSPANPDILLAGMGGFGTVSTTTGQGEWQQLLTGEGSFTAIDPADVQNWYTEAGSGVDILRCTVGTNCNATGFGTVPVIGSTQVEDDADYFTDPAPWILDPLDSANLLLGTCRVWRGPATGGSGWSSANLLSPLLDGDQQPFCNGNAELRSIAAGLDASAPSGSEQIYAGMAGPYDGGGTIPGHIFTSTVPAGTGQTTWVDLYNSPVSNNTNSPQFNQGGFSVSSIAVDPHDPTGHTVYATTQGFSGNGITSGEIYGSTNGGTTWVNLTNNLPLAPANSIVVDPNVPSVLYVALDTGVYYAQNIAACADPAQTCWAVYGSGLPTAPVTSLQVFSAGANSILEASTYGRGIWALALLTHPAQGTLSPASYTFASQQVATTSASTTVTLANTGTTAMAISDVAVTGDYAQTNSCGTSLATTTSCSIQVTFTPTAAGDRPGTLTVFANVSGGKLSSTLDGSGAAPGMLTVTPTSLSFPPTVQGASSPAQTLLVQNTGGEPIHLQTLSVTTDYTLGPAGSDTCSGNLLAPQATCSVSVIFSPTGLQDRPGTLSIPSNLPSSPRLVPLDGTGVTPPALTLSPASLTFSSTLEGSVSPSQSITVKNIGGATAQLQAETVNGDFQIASNSCGSSLVANAICVLQIAYAPATPCGTAGLLTVSANGSGGQATAALTGVDGSATTPCALTLAPTSLSYGAVAIGSTTASQSVSVTNNSSTPVPLGAPSVTGNYSIQGGTCVAHTTLAPSPATGDSCTLQIVFSPTAAGDRAGLLTVPANIAGGSVTAHLDGTGVSPGNLSLSTSLLTFGTLVVGTSSTAQTLTLSNTGGSGVTLQPPVISSQYTVTSNCGAILGAGQLCTLTIVFSPTATGPQPGTLTVSGNPGALQAHATLGGSGVAPASLAFAPTSLAFGSVQAGKASTQQPAILTNTGGISASLHLPVLTGDYAIASNGCGATLAASASCTLQLTFNPTAAGSRTGSLTVTTTDSASSATVSLSGTGTTLVLTPSALVFAATSQGATTAAQNITAANIGTSVLNLQPFTITGDFAISADTCSGTPLNPQYSCTLSITFSPTAGGQRTGLLTVSDAAETHTATLTGTGLSAATDTLSPTSLTFGPQVFGTVSAAQSVSVTNSGGSTLGAISVTATPPFIAANNCGTILGGGLACSIAVTFAPTGPGAQSGQLVITDSLRTQTVSLNGQGVLPPQAVATPTSLDFGSYAVGVASPVQLVTMTNNGKTPLTGFTAVTGTTNFAVASSTCGDTIAAGANCTLGISFVPQQVGNAVDQLTLTSPSLSGSLTVALSGSGEDFQISITGSSSDLITNGQTATYQATVTPVGSSAGTLTITCSGAPANAYCTANPASLSVAGGATGSITVSVVTGLTSTGAVQSQALSPLRLAWSSRGAAWNYGAALALLLPCLLFRGKTRRTFLALLVTLALVLAPTACGVHASGGSSSSGRTGTSGSGTTPPGKYSITITASFPGAQRTATATLTVE
jgi:hypothetical protein